MKTISFARNFLVISSIATLIVVMVVFALGPAFGFPLSYGQSFLVVKQIVPVFIAYLAQATYFVSRQTRIIRSNKIREKSLLPILVISPFLIFFVVFSAVSAAFFLSNSIDAPPETGMSFARFMDWISILLGIFAATVSVLTAWLFGGEGDVEET